jgi:hypothetical protein
MSLMRKFGLGLFRIDRGGFIYSGRPVGSPITKVGFPTRRDPEAYIKLRYAGIIQLENLMAVTNAPNAERLCHHILKPFRYQSFQSKELFYNAPPPHEIQSIFSWAAALVNRPDQLREYASIHNITLEGDTAKRWIKTKHETYDSDDE